jgi:hypothetical protein
MRLSKAPPCRAWSSHDREVFARCSHETCLKWKRGVTYMLAGVRGDYRLEQDFADLAEQLTSLS